MAGHDNIPTLAEQVSRVPTQPGCYLWKDAKGDVIYVGKAKNLRARMRQYVTLQDERQKIPLMMQLVASFDYIVVETEHEALVLERNLIGQYHPYFNVDLKDDKSYPFIAITKGDLYPAIKYTRERHKPGTRYFGPYTDSRAARETIDTLRKVIPICSASCAEWRRCRRIVESHKGEEDIVNMICAQNGRPCFDYHVGRGPGACVGAISPADYAKNVKRVERFLSGHRKDVVDELTSEMTDAAEALDLSARHASNVVWRSSGVWTIVSKSFFPPVSISMSSVSIARRPSPPLASSSFARAEQFAPASSFSTRVLMLTRKSSSRAFLSAITTRRLIFQLRSTFPSSLRMRRRWGSGLRASVSVPAISIGRSVAKSTVCSIWHPKMRAMPSCAT